MTVVAIGFVCLLIAVGAFVGLVVLTNIPLLDQPSPGGESARPGRDDQWVGFTETVPNIRKAALVEREIELAFHPASLDAPDPAAFRWFPKETGQINCEAVRRGRHRAEAVRERAARFEQGQDAHAAR